MEKYLYEDILIDNGKGNPETPLAGIELKRKEYPLYFNFEKEKIIGKATFHSDIRNGLRADLESDRMLAGYPSIMIQIVEQDDQGKITSCILRAVSLCGTPNSDPSIPGIGVSTPLT